MAEIHKTAIVDARAKIGARVTVGPYAVIEGPVVLGAGTEVAAFVLITGQTTLGENCRVFPHAVLGTIPQDLKFGGEPSSLEIGAQTTVREFVTVNRGTRASGTTRVGVNCLLMAYAHVAHDCVLGEGVIMANCATLAGHVEVGEYATVGGLSAVHQFTRIGKYAFVGGMSRVSQDIIPYALTASEPTRVVGINVVGLARRGFDAETKRQLKRAYNILYREGLNTSQALETLKAEFGDVPAVQDIITFVEGSERGILK